MKKTLYLIIFIFCGFLIFDSSFKKNNSKEVQESYTKLLENHPINRTKNLSKEESVAFGIPPNKYFQELYLLEINPYTGRTHPENIYKLRQELKGKRAYQQRTPGDGIDNQWQERGPNNVGGRTRMVMFDPNDTNHKRVFAGGVSGGLWVNDDITDENSSWTSVGIDENLSITCMAVDPNNSQIMYVGTGELYSPQKALGNGIWKSTDGGDTWTNIYKVRGTTVIGSEINVPGTYYITDIIVRDADGNSATPLDSEVFVSIGAAFYSVNPINTYVGLSDYGIYKSTDNGNNWSKIILNVDGNSIAGNDFEIGLDNTLWLATINNFYGKGGGRIYNSTDGNSFTLKHTIANGRRTEISVSNQNANTLYVLSEVKTTVSNTIVAPFISLLKTADAFATLPTALALPADANTSIPANDFTNGQAWYNLMLAVDPTNDAIAYVGGIDLFRTIDSGTSWNQISKSSPSGSLPGITVSYVHADQHIMVFNPLDANSAIFGNDGGVFYSNSLSNSESSATEIEERNKDYNTIQFYTGAISQTTDPEYIVGGTQDNGNLFFNNAINGINSSLKVNRGDGTHCFIDKDGDYMIVSNLYNIIYRYNLPYTGSAVTISSDSNTGRFLNPMDLDENLDILYSNGDDHLARFSNITTNTSIRTNITDALLTNISAVKVSPFTTSSSKVFVGTRAGKVIKVENANTDTQTVTDISSGSFLGNISSIAFGATENEIMVTFYNFGVQSIWFTTDGGTTWENKEGNFPDINVRCILMNPLNTNEVIVGSELGVWNTSNFKDASPVWNQSYNGMSNVAVVSFDFRTSDNTILAATHGRGMFTGKFTGNPLTIWTGNTDADWAKISNWTNGLPTEGVDVKIPNTTIKPVLNAAATLNNLSIESDALLTLNEQAALTIKENVTNNGTFIMNSTIVNSSSLIVEGTATGNLVYNRFVSTNWHLVSSPVIGQNYNDLWISDNDIKSSTSNVNRKALGVYNNNSSWQYFLAGQSSVFNQGIGYTVSKANEGNITFSGNIATTSKNVAISSGSTNSYNLLGNIFASYIPINENADATNNFLTINESSLSEKTMYLWNGGPNYEAINQLFPGQFLAPGQAFFVSSKPGNHTVSFTTAMQQHQTATFLKTKEINAEIKLTISTAKEKRSTSVFYLDGATLAFDNGYDSSLFIGVSSDFEVYTKMLSDQENKKLAIQSLPKDYSLIIPVGVILPANAQLEFSISSKNIPSNLKVFLEDKKLNIFTLLENDGNSYVFSSKEKTTDADRFYLHTINETLGMVDFNFSNIKIYNSKQKIYLSNLPQGKKTIQIYNVIGKKIVNKEMNSSETVISTDQIVKGIYIVEIKTAQGTKSKKIIIQ